MKKYYLLSLVLALCMVLIMSFGLFGCSKYEPTIIKSWSAGKPSGDLYLSAEIVSDKKINMESEFEIRIGIGRFTEQYPNARFEITATNLAIVAPDGTNSENHYQVIYNDFNDSKYGLVMADDTELKYFEHFKFKYIGNENELQGCISFKIVAVESTGEELSGTTVGIYYEVNDGKISISTERPINYNPNNQLTE